MTPGDARPDARPAPGLPAAARDLAPAHLAARPFGQAIAALDEAFPFDRHPYLAWAAAPGTSREAFLATQLPFRHAVEGFSRALAATLARVPAVEDRLPLWRNLAEEHGHGTLAASHKATYAEYLAALGAPAGALDAAPTAPVLAFEQALLGWCLTQPAEAGAAALGAIEQAYVPVSGAIARTIHARGWVQPGSQRHYEVHEALDVVHARDLLAIAEAGWAEVGPRRGVATGLVLGAAWFWTLYDQLLPPHAP